MGFILTALVPKQEGGKQRIIGLEWISKHLPIYLLTLWLLSVLKTGLEIYVISPFYIVFENLHPFSIWHFVIGIFWYFGLLPSKKKKKKNKLHILSIVQSLLGSKRSYIASYCRAGYVMCRLHLPWCAALGQQRAELRLCSMETLSTFIVLD